ncbi:DUF2254 domain-containing protein [Actinokineospora sp. NBRC 105648]|uniref:DUF2254 domain-containing protein n=1 Tax=Actinokineospora sp. NBRC 105648 TaxID=3032206 RepID=UPI0024A1FA5F|nr:DUF2254 domain-containing protein [Actinokineospora sp. NBRC 105648]GLZ42266.1 hypothetical protein Acsp05_58900 [Actinokineospora sp. NBRC 105648]
MSALRDALRTQLWPVPTAGVVLAVALGVTLPEVDARIDGDLPSAWTAYLFGGGADAARSVLAAIAGSLITVTSLTFSLTVVTLQLASGQFSPRLLRTFTRDRFVHVTLALFLATFAYALTVLRTVRTADGVQPAFVPQASVTLAFLLALASVVFLVLFLAHLARKIRVETMVRDVHVDADATVSRLLVERGRDSPRPVFPMPPPSGVPVLAASSGFLGRVDESALLAAAVDADAIIVIDRRPGDSVVTGTPIGVCWPRNGDAFTQEISARLLSRAPSAVSTQTERTSAQDVGFGLRQLTDVAVKALSPGINDPTTAIHALGHSAALLARLAGHDLGHRALRDGQDLIRVVLHRPDLGDLLDMAVSQPRRYGAADPALLGRLLMLLRELAWTVDLPDHRRVIGQQLARLRATADSQDFDGTEREHLRYLGDQVGLALRGQWTSE